MLKVGKALFAPELAFAGGGSARESVRDPKRRL